MCFLGLTNGQLIRKTAKKNGEAGRLGSSDNEPRGGSTWEQNRAADQQVRNTVPFGRVRHRLNRERPEFDPGMTTRLDSEAKHDAGRRGRFAQALTETERLRTTSAHLKWNTYGDSGKDGVGFPPRWRNVAFPKLPTRLTFGLQGRLVTVCRV